MKLRYLIPSLIAAGFLPARAVALPAIPRDDDGPKNGSLFDLFKLTHIYTLASHSSHSSHASHASHRSSSGGGIYIPPRPRYVPPLPSALPQLCVPSPGLTPLSPSTDKAKLIVAKVQNGLCLFGYQVPINGVVGPETRAALLLFQTQWDQPVTGTITPQVLDALGIAAD